MAKLMVVGEKSQVRILTDPQDEELTLAKCVLHAPRHGAGIKCVWQERYDTTDDAWAGAEQHADGVR